MQQLTDVEYTKSHVVLFNASIGKHVGHIIELFICFEKGYDTGTVNYEKPKKGIPVSKPIKILQLNY